MELRHTQRIIFMYKVVPWTFWHVSEMVAASEPSDFNKMVKKGSGFESLVKTSNFLIFISHILQTRTMQVDTNNNQ